jgi:L-aspartate oxidase
MEFMQGGVAYSHPKTGALFCYMWEGCPELYNGKRERFIHKYLPEQVTVEAAMRAHAKHFPFSTRDDSKYIDIAIHKEITEGRGTTHGGIVIDFSKFTPEYVRSVSYDMKEMWPQTVAFYRAKGMDFEKDTIELDCFGHAINGGVKIDRNASTNVEGLFAAGEVSTGAHGADRLGGSMLTQCQVFGFVAGTNAARFSTQVRGNNVDEAFAIETVAPMLKIMYKKLDLATLMLELQETASSCLLIRRTGAGLSHMMDVLGRLDSEIDRLPTKWHKQRKNMEFANMIYSARLMCTAALLRKESRGSHFREDFPTTDPAYDHVIYV